MYTRKAIMRGNPPGISRTVRVTTMEVKPGFRVVRGPDWEWGDQDGGEGHVGTVVEVGEPSVSDGGSYRAVVVQWDCGGRCRYRCGHERKYDLRVYDTAPAGIIQQSFADCDCCVSIGITGLVWQCCSCQDCSLCSMCYFNDKHLVEHRFIRMDTTHTRCRVKPREGSRKVMCKGLFPGAKVQHIDDEGVPQRKGLIETIKDHNCGARSIAVVKWETTMSISECKVGCDGKVDLICSTPANNGYYYPDHLPVLGMPLSDDELTNNIIAGDYVRVELDVEVFKIMQTEEHGGWQDAMASLVGKVGRVRCIRDSGDLFVTYNGHNSTILLNSEAVAKMNVQEYRLGDAVRIMDDKEKALKQQREFGLLWLEEMNDTTNRLGVVEGRDDNGNVAVAVNGKTYLYSPFCIEWIQAGNPSDVKGSAYDSADLRTRVHQLLEQSNPDVLAYAAQLEDDTYVREYLATCPNEVNRIVDGMAPIHYATKLGKKSTVKALIEYNADVDITDEYSRTPLHYCSEYCPNKYCLELCQLLLEAGADPNKKNVVGETPLIKAVNCRDSRTVLGLTSSQKTDVHIEDLEGQTALHLAVSEGLEILVKILVTAGADPTRVNHKLESSLLLAAGVGFAGAVKVMIEHHQECINAKDEDGCTALHIAVLNNSFTCVTMLLKQPSCDIDVKTNLDRTALHAAVLSGYTYLVEQLVGYGANLNVKDHEGCTPLHTLLLIDISGITISFQPLSDSTPELQKVKQLLQNEDIDTRTVMACFFIQEGADMSQMGILGLSSSQTLAIGEAVNAPLISRVKEFAGKFAGTGRYHGSLRPTSTGDVAGNTREDRGSSCYTSELLVSPPHTNAERQSMNICELCEDEPIDVRFLPCKHAVICSICAKRATKCIKCKKPITGKENIV